MYIRINNHAVVINMEMEKTLFIEFFIYDNYQLIELFNLSNCDFKNLRCFFTTCIVTYNIILEKQLFVRFFKNAQFMYKYNWNLG